MKRKYLYLGVILLIIIFIGIFAYLSFSSENSINTSNLATYENEYVKFKIPEGVQIEANSSKAIDITILKNGTEIGKIFYIADYEAENPENSKLDRNKGLKNITISGYRALQYTDSLELGSYIILERSKGIFVNFDPDYENEYKVVKNTFVIKKVPG